MTDPTWIGVWLLVACFVVIVFESVLAAVWSARLARHTRALTARVMSEQAEVKRQIATLRASLAEMQLLWQPYRSLLRWLRHPIAIALMQSYARRRTAAR